MDTVAGDVSRHSLSDRRRLLRAAAGPAPPDHDRHERPEALAVTARLADSWNWDGPWDEVYRKPYEALRQHCAAIGRRFEDLTLTAGLSVSMPDDATTFVPSYEHSFYPGAMFPYLGPEPSDVVREIERLVDVGVSHFQVSFEDFATYRRFIEKVVPVVRLEPAASEGEISRG